MNTKQLFLTLTVLSAAATIAAGTPLEKLDANFRPATVGKLQVNYFNAFKKPFELTGFPWWDGKGGPYRVPRRLTAREVRKALLSLAHHSSGGAIRFRTDSPFITLRCTYKSFNDSNHMPRGGSGGFDLYTVKEDGSESYLGTLHPGKENATEPMERRFGKVVGGKVRSYTIYLPLYSGIKELEIGLKPGAQLLPPHPQKIRKPILFYGSSITQGGCASRPANNYTTMLCRAVDAPQINLGFSGNARGETAMAKAISELDLAVFVMDYDYNAPDVKHLAKTHEPFFKIIRKAHPDLPIILLSRCSLYADARRDVIRRTYENAVKAGDKRVWFIDGSELFGEAGVNFCTVDTCHPNDLGFYMMYRRILPVLKEALMLSR